MRSSYPIPSEEDRVSLLKEYAVLDTLPEQAFDEITRMAAAICGTPIALVSLVDEGRQWFKSRVGLETPETPREHSFCAHTLEKREMMIVPNALEDVRFARNPLVQEDPKIRFYAGVPLVSPENAALGTLCVIDQVPRTLTEAQMEALRFLSGQVMTHFELRRQMVALRASEERFVNAFEHAPIGMTLVSTEGRFLKVNQALCDLVGYSVEELHRKNFQEITYPEDLEMDLGHVRELLDGAQSTYRMEKRYLHKQGHLVWVDLSVSIVRDKLGVPLYFISQIQDITENKAALEKQTELTQRAQGAEKAKSDFLATMSHEIRTPLNGVIGMTSVLIDTELSELQRQCVETINVSGETLLGVINDILDFSKIEAGRLEIENRPFHLPRCLEEVLDLFSSQLQARHLKATCDIKPGVPAMVEGDVLRLRQILINLVGNAIKFTEAGGVSIRVECREAKNDSVDLLFSVADTGIGMDQEGINRLFQPFQQVDSSMTRRYGGTGLGLAISKRLAESMGGTMWAESQPGVGSTFFVSSIFKATSQGGLTKSQSVKINRDARKLDGQMAAKTPLRILLAEDNSVNQKVALMILSRLGYTADIVSNGQQVAGALRARSYDVILMDIQMPEMNGVEATRLAREEMGERCPYIIALTADALEGAEERFLDLGFDDYLSKPIQASALQAKLKAVKLRES